MPPTFTALILQWHALRGAVSALRAGEEGMTTLEVLVIAAGLVLIAGLAVAMLKKSTNNESASLP